MTQFFLPSTSSFTSGMNHTCLYSQPQSITALSLVLLSRPTEGWRLSWPGTTIYHVTVSNSSLLFTRGAVTGFPNFGCIRPRRKGIFLPVILTNKRDLDSVTMNHLTKYLGQRSSTSKVIVRTENRHTHIQAHTVPPGPQKW